MSRKVIAIAAAIVVVLVLLVSRLAAQPPPAPETESEPELIERFVSASAVVLPARQAKLGFKIGGRVREVRVAAGQGVKAGDVLVRLEDGELQQQVAVARANLELAQATLAQVMAGSRPEEIAAAQASYEGSAARYEQGVGPAAAADVQAAGAGLALAKERLAQAQAAAKAELRAADANLAAAQARLAQLEAGPRLEEIRAAELQLEQARNTLWATQIDRDGLCGNAAVPEYQCDAGNARVAAAETAVTTATNALAKIRAGATPDELATARAAMEQASAQLEVRQSTKDASVLAAEAAVASAAARLAQVREGPVAAERKQLASNVAAAKAQLELRQAGPGTAEVAIAQARVKQAEAALAGALLAANEAALVAPFDGTVAAVAIDEGQIVAPGEVAVTFGDLSKLRLETTDLRETNVARVRAGQPVTITLDALPGRELQGKVASVAPAASASTGGTSFAVRIELGEQDRDLRWGMTALVEIPVEPLQ